MSRLLGARKLIDLAQKDEGLSSVLSACVIFLLAAGLEQATRTELAMLIQFTNFENDKSQSPKASSQWGLCFRDRVFKLAEWKSGHRLRMNNDHEFVKAIEELIVHRNNLAHTEEMPEMFEDVELIRDKDKTMVVVFKSLPKSSWDEIDLGMVKLFEKAVLRYFADVIDGKKDNLEQSDFLIPRDR